MPGPAPSARSSTGSNGGSPAAATSCRPAQPPMPLRAGRPQTASSTNGLSCSCRPADGCGCLPCCFASRHSRWSAAGDGPWSWLPATVARCCKGINRNPTFWYLQPCACGENFQHEACRCTMGYGCSVLAPVPAYPPLINRWCGGVTCGPTYFK